MRIWVGIAVWVGISSTAVLAGQGLSSPTAIGWQAYVAATEARVARARDLPLSGREAVDRGQVVVEEVTVAGPNGDLEVPGATVNHWRGLILIPGARLDDVLMRLEREPPDTRQQDVLASAVIGQRPGWLKVSLRVQRSFVLAAVFDTEHEVTFRRHGVARASSQSTATKIVEVENAGTSLERQKRPDEDRGLLWRWNAYWRYEQVERGVLVECEALTLSRRVPTLLSAAVGPIVNKLARESMERTLVAFRERFSGPGSGKGS